MNQILELLRDVKAVESFIPANQADRFQSDRVNACTIARKTLAIQQAMRLKFPHLSNAEFKRQWVALNAVAGI